MSSIAAETVFPKQTYEVLALSFPALVPSGGLPSHKRSPSMQDAQELKDSRCLRKRDDSLRRVYFVAGFWILNSNFWEGVPFKGLSIRPLTFTGNSL